MALITGSSGEPGDQGRAESDALAVVRDGNGELSHTRLTADADVARDRDSLARGRIDREECLMIAVIDVDRVVDLDLALGHSGFGTREP